MVACSRVRARLRASDGFTVVETLFAAVLLVAGLLATFALLDAAQQSHGTAAAREGATNLAREVLEDSRDLTFADLDVADRQRPALESLEGRSAAVTAPGANSLATSVSRRGITYGITVSWCSVDDARDGLGARAAGTAWCADSTAGGLADSHPKDLKRVTVRTTWTVGGRSQPAMVQTATFGSGGAAVAPPVPRLELVTPGGLSPTAPVITSNPSGGNVTFRGTSFGAADMRFSVDGVERLSGVVNNGNGTWSFDWNVVPLKDGVYTIGAVAIDALGTRSAPAVLQVKLARGAPSPVTNVVGGYNDVFKNDVQTRVVELAWDGSADGSVTGYEVLKGTTVVCPASLATSCIDLTPASTGSTDYTIRTLYSDALGNPAALSTPHTVTAPTSSSTSIATVYGFTTGTANRTGCNANGTAGRQDLVPDFPTSGGTTTRTTGVVVGCMAPFPAGVSMAAGTTSGQFSGWWYNPSGNRDCNTSYYLYLNGTTYIAFGSFTIPRGYNPPRRITVSFQTSAQTFAAGDRLSFIVYGGSTNTTCANAGVAFDYGSGAAQSTLTLPLSGGSSGGSTLQRPGTPGGLSITVNADGTRTLTWTAPSGTPAVDFYRIYRDGRNYTNRFETAGATGSTVTWMDTATGGTSHTYRVTAVSAELAESAFAGPVTG